MQVKIDAEPVESGEKKDKTPDDWEVDNWVRTLLEAEAIKADPAKMKHVQPKLQKQAKAINNLADLKAVAKEKMAAAEK